VAAVKGLAVHIVSTVISKITRYRCHAVMVTYIRDIRSSFFGVVPVSSIVVGIAGLCAAAMTVRVRSHVEAISFFIGLSLEVLY
jgi:hypothetical protein